MEKVFDAEWWHSLPTMLNPEYTYLVSIIKTAQDALKEQAQNLSGD